VKEDLETPTTYGWGLGVSVDFQALPGHQNVMLAVSDQGLGRPRKL